MSKSTLSQVLAAFEESTAPKTLTQIARDLDLSPARLEGMIQYWVRKGKLRETTSFADCGTCGRGENCPFVVELPRSYELAAEDARTIPLATIDLTCGHRA